MTDKTTPDPHALTVAEGAILGAAFRISTVLPEGEVHMRDGEGRLVGKIVNVATCDSRGHLRGPGEKCVFCGIPLEKPLARPTGSNADEWALFLEHWLGPVQGINFVAVQIAEAIEGAKITA